MNREIRAGEQVYLQRTGDEHRDEQDEKHPHDWAHARFMGEWIDLRLCFRAVAEYRRHNQADGDTENDG